MSMQEKKSIVYTITTLIISIIYGIIMYGKYNDGSLNDENIFRFWAIIILIYVGVSIVAQILVTILFAIVNAVVAEVKGVEEENIDFVDERDKLIELKAQRTSMMVFSIGFMIALVTQLFDVSNHVFFIVLLIAGFISELLSQIQTVCKYRRGV